MQTYVFFEFSLLNTYFPFHIILYMFFMCVRTLPGHYIYGLLFLYFFTQQPKTYISFCARIEREFNRKPKARKLSPMLNKYFLIRIMNKTLLLDVRVVANVIFIGICINILQYFSYIYPFTIFIKLIENKYLTSYR